MRFLPGRHSFCGRLSALSDIKKGCERGGFFERVRQIEEKALRKLGIGLTIAKELVKAHGGRLEVKSTRGKEAVFIVSLPLDGVHNSS